MDNEGEYTSQKFNNYLKDKMIRRQLTWTNTTQQNEVDEREIGIWQRYKEVSPQKEYKIFWKN